MIGVTAADCTIAMDARFAGDIDEIASPWGYETPEQLAAHFSKIYGRTLSFGEQFDIRTSLDDEAPKLGGDGSRGVVFLALAGNLSKGHLVNYRRDSGEFELMDGFNNEYADITNFDTMRFLEIVNVPR